MRHFQYSPLAWAACLVTLTSAVDAPYVTELDIFSLLAPCAADAISYNVALETYSTKCPEDASALQSCICSDTKEFQLVSTGISNSVIESCGTLAMEDLSSAASVMAKYCTPDRSITFATPTTNLVNGYITDLPELTYLPPCAQSVVSEAVMGMYTSRCPDPASLFAPCVCTRSYIVDNVNDILSLSVRSMCSNQEDVTSAQNFYSEYCAMNEGTTSFAKPQGPPGDMSYYITALPQFKSLNACAQDGAASAVFEQTYDKCGSGPQALASCVCLKSGLLGEVSKSMSSYVKDDCDSTATADVTSALAVLDYYCSAAESKVVAKVAESITMSDAVVTGTGSDSIDTRARSTSPIQTGSGGSSNNGGNDSSNKDGSSDNGNNGGGSGGVNKKAIVAAGVLGGVVVITIVLTVAFFVRRKRSQVAAKNEAQPGVGAVAGPAAGGHHGEKLGVELPTYDHTQKAELQGAVSTVLGLSPAESPRSELQSDGMPYQYSPYGHQPHELPSPLSGHPQQQHQQQAHFQGQSTYEAYGTPGPYHYDSQAPR